MQTQTSNTLHNAIMEADSKDRPPMLAPGNYVQWKSRIKRYIDIKLNHELIHYCLKNPPYKLDWKEKKVPISEGSHITRTERVHETYQNVTQEIRDQLNAEAEAVQIILTGIDNDIYSIVDACPNACEMWKVIERLKQGDSINVHDLETNLFWEFRKFTSQDGETLESYYSRSYKMMNELIRNQCNVTNHQDKEIDKLMALISISFKKIYKPTNNNLRTSSNTSRANQDNSLRINKSARYEHQRISNVAGARETIGSSVVQKSRIQCYNCKEFGHVARECQKSKRAKDAAYHKEKILLCKQEEAGIQLNVKQADWKDDTDDDELEDHELEAHYMYMAQLQEVSPDVANSGPIFDDEPLQKVLNDDHYNVFAMESAHPEQFESIHHTYPSDQYAHNVIIDSLDMSNDREEIDQNDDDNDFAKERDMLASLIKKLKYQFHRCLNEEMVADLRYFNSLELEVDSLISQLETQKTYFLNEIDRLSREYYYADYMNAILGVYTELDEVTNLQCDYLELLEKCERLETELSKSKMILNTKTLNVKSVCATCDTYVLKDKHDMCVLKSVAKPLKKTIASESNQKPRNITRKLYECFSKTCSWWYPKFTPSGYKWKPKSGKENVNPNVSMPLKNASRTANVMDTMTSRCSTVSNTPLSSILLQLEEIVLFIVDSRCSKHMTGNLKLLINFVEKFLGTVKFGNDQVVPILGYGDLVQGAVMIKRVYYVEGLNHNLFSVGQFCDADLEVAFRKSTCFIRDLKGNDLTDLSKEDFKVRTDKGTKFLNQTLHVYFTVEGIHHQTSVAQTSEQNGVVERWNLIPRHEKVPYHIINDQKPSVKFFHIFGSLCYIVIDGENLDKMKEKGDECIFVGYFNQSRAYRVFNKRTRVIMESNHVNFDELPQMASDQISSDPAPEWQSVALEHASLSPAIQRQADRTVTTSNELDLLFSLMFDELLNGFSKVVSKSSAVFAADAPNQRQHHTTPLNIHTTPAPTCQVPILAPTVTSYENINQAETYTENDQVADDEFINIFCILVQDQGETSSHHVDSSNMHTFYQRYPSEHRWTKDHPLEQVIGNPSQSVRTRRQLESNAEMCMFALTVNRTEPKNIKEAMADSAWIESMQEELHQFDRLDIWELVDRQMSLI
nr:hypothetical protein [Tanacetum cinerariifolium]